ncbi:MAG: hypothetical protein SV062_08005 [Thermodesulfobacteriota bacterium]|nr:hypothetical protein [Thermodesulfobacteriota bacterium]
MKIEEIKQLISEDKEITLGDVIKPNKKGFVRRKRINQSYINYLKARKNLPLSNIIKTFTLTEGIKNSTIQDAIEKIEKMLEEIIEYINWKA